MSDLRNFTQVPDGSTLEMSVSPAAGLASTARVFESGHGPHDFNHGQLTTGTATLPLTSPRAYMAEIRVAFVADIDAAVRIEIKRPDGSTHSKPAVWEFPGQNGDIAFRAAFVRTA